MTTLTPQRYRNVDALRAIAATVVVVQHFFGDVIREAHNPGGPLVRLFTASVETFDLGRFGVVLFFLISGFVVPFSIRGSQPLRRFALSRFFRLYPALWLAVFVLCLWFAFHGSPPSPTTILANLSMVPNLLGHAWLSGIYWTLSIEIIFYILSAGLFWFGALFRPGMVTLFAALLVGSTAMPIYGRILLGIDLPVQYIGLHLSFLYCGLLLRLAIVDRAQGAAAGAGCLIALQFAVLLTIGNFSLRNGDSFFLEGRLPIIAAYIAAFAAFGSAVLWWRPQSRLLSFGAEISYSLYLFHGVVALVVYSYLPLTGHWSDLLTGLVSFALAVLASHLVYRSIEKPAIRLGQKVAPRNDRHAAAVV